MRNALRIFSTKDVPDKYKLEIIYICRSDVLVEHKDMHKSTCFPGYHGQEGAAFTVGSRCLKDTYRVPVALFLYAGPCPSPTVRPADHRTSL